MKQAGNDHDLKSEANREQIVQKLPLPVRSRWARYALRLGRTADLSDLDQLLRDVVEEELLIRPTEELLVSTRDLRRGDKQHKPPAKSTAKPATTLPPTVLATEARDEQSSGCAACGQPHALPSCAEFKRKTPSERAHIIKDAGFCFRCLRGRHKSANCGSKSRCGVSGCQARHHTMLHGAERVYPDRGSEVQQTVAESSESTQEKRVFAVAPEPASEVLLAVVPVQLVAGGRSLDTYALLDSGSEATLLRKDAAEKLAL